MRHIAGCAAVILLSATTLLAGGLSKYKDWDKSPQGYFLTAAERAQWAAIRNDADAEAFVNAFLAKRPESFPDDVAKNAANADKYFTVGSTKGSTTERGKLVILLGPPGGLSYAKKETRGEIRSTPQGSMNALGDGGPAVSDMASAANGAGSGGGVLNEYTFTYPADKLPAAYGKPLTVKIEVDGGGHDRITDRKLQAELDRLYELVAQSKVGS